MSRTLRTLAAVVAGLALVAALPAPCPCAPKVEAGHAEHECCAPSTGVRSNDHGCCETVGALVDQAGVPPVPEALAPALAGWVPGSPVLSAHLGAHRLVAFDPPRPPAVLRI